VKRVRDYLPLLFALLLGVFITLMFQAGCRTIHRAGPVPVGEPTLPPAGEGWIDLFDKENASDWENVTDDRDLFRLEAGVLHLFGTSVYPLRYIGYTGREFRDFELHVEFRIEGGGNSGIFLWADPDAPVQRGFEVQILDDHGRAPDKRGSGAIYDVVTPMYNLARPAGEWNSYDIRVEGSRVTVLMNGFKVIDTDFDLLTQPVGKFETPYAELERSGLILIQDHGGEAWFRNMRVRSLE